MDCKPIASFLILSYNQEKYIRDCLHSVFEQQYQPLEIIISDDFSSDNTFEIIKDEIEKYNGPHSIILNKNQKNMGLAENMNIAWKLSSGKYIIAGAGDDIFFKDRVQKLVKRLENKIQPVDLAVSSFVEIDENGKKTGVIEKDVAFLPDVSTDVTKWMCGATGACASYNRKLYDKYGPLDPDVIAEDWVFSFRAWLEDGIAVLDEPLVLRRKHGQSLYETHKNVKNEVASKTRRNLRREGARNRYGIAKEWFKAYKIRNKLNGSQTLSELSRLVYIREMQFRVFDARKLDVIKISMKIAKHIGIKETLKILIRNLIGYH